MGSCSFSTSRNQAVRALLCKGSEGYVRILDYQSRTPNFGPLDDGIGGFRDDAASELGEFGYVARRRGRHVCGERTAAPWSGVVDRDEDGDGDGDGDEGDGDMKVVKIGRWRAVCVILSMWAQLFLQASNMSGMTMTQSTIADALNSYASAMWFTTAYLIAASALSPLLGRLCTIFPLAPSYYRPLSLFRPAVCSSSVLDTGPHRPGVGSGRFLALPPNVGVSERSKHGSLREKLVKIDYLGACLLTITIVFFLYGLAGDIQPTPLIISVGTLGMFVFAEYYIAADPIIPIKVLSSRGILLSCLANLGFMAARWTLLYYAPVFMLAVQGYSPPAAGSILVATNFGFGSGGLIIGWLHIRRGGSFWLPSAISMAVFSATLYLLSTVGYPNTPAVIMALAGTQFITTSLMGTVRGFGGSFGTAIGGGVFYRLLRAALERGYADLDGTHDGLTKERAELVRKLLGSPNHVFSGGLGLEERQVAIEGYAGASRATWAAAAGLGLVVVFIQLGTGWTSPEREKNRPVGTLEHREEEDEEARAALLESEGVGEA
ncbi:unnamed protein product [Parascedosporium putredinis]|uniref:MFS general substrate transporter n=1 Tax=Parascedosporium putredinis TaxID=1442378 RepID=A0A9P1GYJ0_9PEZI|nr:unnamed protein product [Parascedosporium putredinis]CAI7990041.1 unnamed protein product [Parascedosporium putredinis]